MTDPLNALAAWFQSLLIGWGFPENVVSVILAIIGIVIICVFVLLVDIFLVWLERKVVARFQDRLGPNRLGPFGLIQPFADVFKLLIKEDITPEGASRFVFNLPPIIALATVLLMWAVIPLAPTVLGADINVGVLYIIAIGAISTLGIIMAGWASNNKYALLGAFRTVAQMISYEIPMVISLLIPVLLASSMSLNDIVTDQSIWNIIIVPLAAVIFLLSSIAELGRAPFDLVEAESEIVAGFHIEYTGMKFGLFYAGELLHALTVGAIFAIMFLGGWRGPGVNLPYIGPFLGIFYLFIKAFIIYYVTMWFKYSLPRLRIDHMLGFNWKFLTPLALVLLMVVAVLDKVLTNANVTMIVYVLVMITANILIGWAAISLARANVKRERQLFEQVGQNSSMQMNIAEENSSAMQS
jgi:NADH-quinone oxidoreductase subunit H